MVVNSHLEGMYVAPFKFLSTGGIIGDALFFFCSGYKLSLGRTDRFDNWYKRRLVRIYPSVLVWDVLAALLFSLPLTVGTLFDGWWFCGYWFVKCIMVHYVALYFVMRYFRRWMSLLLGGVCVGIGVWWWLAYSPKFAMAMLGASKFEWYYLFAFTLFGAIVASRGLPKFRTVSALSCLFLALLCHYGWLIIVGRCPNLMPIRLLLLLPLAAVVVSLYLLSKTDFVIGMMNGNVGKAMTLLGGLCLEVYISHGMFETVRFNNLFPLNIIGYFAVVFIVAYFIRCVTRLFIQTFDKEHPYDYHSVFKE